MDACEVIAERQRNRVARCEWTFVAVAVEPRGRRVIAESEPFWSGCAGPAEMARERAILDGFVSDIDRNGWKPMGQDVDATRWHHRRLYRVTTAPQPAH
jgi:hypothetical protein